MSSRNPDIDELGKNKARLILLNKSDLANDSANEEWITFFKAKGYQVAKINSKTGYGIKTLNGIIMEACKEKLERDKRKGIKNRPIRAMVVGIPNVGKSTFINSFAGKACTKTGNKPGVTKGKQWIKLRNNVELLDTPGILWPKFEDEAVGTRLAFIGSVNDEILNIEELSLELMQFLKESYKGAISGKYDVDESLGNVELLENIGIKRGCKKAGNVIDYKKTADLIFDDFRAGKLGKITLEFPKEYQ